MPSLARRLDPRRWSRTLRLALLLVASLGVTAFRLVSPLLEALDDPLLEAPHDPIDLPTTALPLPPIPVSVEMWVSLDGVELNPHQLASASSWTNHCLWGCEAEARQLATVLQPARRLVRLVEGRLLDATLRDDVDTVRERSQALHRAIASAVQAGVARQPRVDTQYGFSAYTWFVDRRVPMATLYALEPVVGGRPTLAVQGAREPLALPLSRGHRFEERVVLRMSPTAYRVFWVDPSGAPRGWRTTEAEPWPHHEGVPRTGADRGVRRLRELLSSLHWKASTCRGALSEWAHEPYHSIPPCAPLGVLRLEADGTVAFGEFVETVLAIRALHSDIPLFPHVSYRAPTTREAVTP